MTDEDDRDHPLLAAWLRRFVVFAILLGAWTVSLPDFSGPDEPAHVLRAAAVAGGDLETDRRDLGEGESWVTDIPRSLTLGSPIAVCYVFDPTATPCGPPFVEDDTAAEGITTAGAAPPFFYALVGVPLRIEPDARGLLLARLVNAAACAALLATAAAFALRARRRAFLLLGLGVAVTPMACYLASIVSPSGIEIAAGIATWVLLLVVASSERPLTAGTAAVLVAAGATLVLSRALSAAFMVLIAAAVVLALGWRALDPRRRLVQVALACLGVSFALAAAWVLTHDPTELVPALIIQPKSLVGKVMVSVGKTGSNVEQMIAAFGWLDTPSPRGVHLAWLFALGVLVLFAMVATRERRGRLALVLVFAASFLIPIVIEVRGYDLYGPIWQGRYILPVAAGVPLLAGVLLDRAPGAMRALLETPRAVLIALLWLAHVTAFWFLLRRYSMGADASVFIPLHPEWSPRLHPWLLAAIVAAASGEWALWLIRAGRRGAGDPATTPDGATEAILA